MKTRTDDFSAQATGSTVLTSTGPGMTIATSRSLGFVQDI